MPSRKDSDDVIEFMSLFVKLKDLSDDDPNRLPDLANADAAVRGLCERLSWAAWRLQISERRYRHLFVAPVDPKFINAWRDFEDRYQRVLIDLVIEDLFSGLEEVETTPLAEADLQWEFANVEATQQAGAIERAIDFAHDQATQDWRNFDDEGEFRESIEDGKAAWKRLEREAGFDLRGVFRRRSLIPFVLVPTHVSDKHGSAEVVSLLKSLQQAHEAFIFGTPFAALALMRAIMEAVLRDYYGQEKKGSGTADQRCARSTSAGCKRGSSRSPP